ncbi:CCA tRNA nucleotidyltransferase [Pseudidiomarina sp.]|uniref:CCA tRNA nucleotidyltransferase n=1 Tax=Pseudidiomarina sp. TaxID=2081707 RepID=UPI00299DC04D|nr:CCA tRNA nucleotidyltransferase [Pseudidiomarina sp.]MDX1705976.1 CCA tRNA nucleotidyltransferase [Pseudidiomarina sp.]
MQIYLVGGAVRDKLLDKPVTERDYVVIGSTPSQLQSFGFRQVGKDFPVFLHPKTGEEYALARTERKSAAGYTGFTVDADPSVTLEDDLRRRDLTINAIAESEEGELIDPYHGLDDLKARVLRHVSPAFVEDPLRVLRVARFAARFHKDGFSIANETMQLMAETAATGELATLSCERVWRETQLALSTTAPHIYFDVLAAVDALEPWFVELTDAQQRARALDYLAALERDESLLRFAAMASALSAVNVETLCNRLKVPNEYRFLAILAQRITPEQVAEATATELLALFNQSDSWRRPDRHSQLTAIWHARGVATDRLETINKAWEAAAKVEAGPLLAAAESRGEALRGPAVGEAVEQARLQRIQDVLEGS